MGRGLARLVIVTLASISSFACTAKSGTAAASEREERPEPAVEPELEPEAEPEPEASPAAGMEGYVVEAIGEIDGEEFTVHIPMSLSRERLVDGWRWVHVSEHPREDPRTLSVTLTATGREHPESLEQARAQLALEDMEELTASLQPVGFFFVHTDAERSTLVVNYLAERAERALRCSVDLRHPGPIPDFEAVRWRFENSCLKLGWLSREPIPLGRERFFESDEELPAELGRGLL